ncbi:ankyrin repeat domain-containing protein [Leptospira sp. WS39.C2]
MVKLEWYHYIFLSTILIKDAIEKGSTEITNGIQNYKEFRSLPELHKAVLRSDMDRIKQLINSGVNLEEKDKKGETALFYALDKNLVNIARYLIQNHADVNVTNHNGKPAILTAIQFNQYDLVKLMLNHGLKLQNPNGTVLTLACNTKQVNFKLVQLFVEQGVSINAKDKNSYSALMYLATNEAPNLDIIRYLIQKGADVNAKDRAGKSILRLLIEARTHHLRLIQILLENHADPNLKDNEGQTIFDFIQNYYDHPETNEVVIYLKKYRRKSK